MGRQTILHSPRPKTQEHEIIHLPIHSLWYLYICGLMLNVLSSVSGDSGSSSREGGGGGETGGSGHPDQNDSQSSKPRKGGAAMGKARFRKGKS